MTFTHSVSADGSHIFQNLNTSNYLLLTSDGSIEVSQTIPSIYDSKLSTGNHSISCIIGVIKLKISSYVIISDQHTITGSILGNEIAKVESYKILPLGNNQFAKSNAEEAEYLKLLNQHLSNATLYFSIDNKYDVTNSLQRQYTTANLQPDPRFMWNKFLSTSLIENGANEFVTPLIYGYFKSHSATFNGPHLLDFALLTRRANSRAGTRYFRRGIDTNGNVANFNETEQIFTAADNHVYSFLQTRGSVPVYWGEINNLKYKPNLVISSKPALLATEKHFTEQVELYGDNYLVNLVNQKGYELPVKQSYEAAVDNLPEHLAKHINYIYFDFHHECKGMRYDRINLLLERLIQLGYTSDNYFSYDLAENKILSVQNKIVRTNCMDCLDRTNVVQGELARWVLQNQFIKSGYIEKDTLVTWNKIDPKFNLFFQNFWADNADAVSCAYSGTGALKTDFTRLGKRTYKGALNDLSNSITRYYKNNLKDGSRQDSYDLFLGNYKPFQDSINSPFIDRRPDYIQLLPYLMGTSLLVLLTIIYYPRGSIFDFKNLVIIGACLYLNARGLFYMLKDGYQFVDWPKLSSLDFLEKEEIGNGSIKYRETEHFKSVGKKKN
ncbi:uncharacterized protein SPAPADRAFT_61390 [Spathaspora passalidarum NRRL Y-27907]|uniref:SAC domain-containing protein n=1 Tax=Spathaspora passalidarum (strain NRRL Y-27907 / 11-Y1) TaxID=619300 RepID=G3APZ3_SPAPN|nr:uncharacterized protein SPAPADRAFT_61390 [Spathaspora passalidarum NRRL Y-27907]EGW32314.1 hypothetical protein SPAPADRAFT_61390 [Spathaspora passalidarum NRRL Y-27907]